MNIRIDNGFQPDSERRKEILAKDLGFGRYFTDRMFTMDYDLDRGWHNPRIGPFEDFRLSPAAAVLHYGQAIFEGQKAYCWSDGEIALFRPEMNARRFQKSALRLVMPPVPEDVYLQAVETLVDLEREWVPRGELQSLYIRPYCFSSEALLGVRAAGKYRFAVILSPVGAYYASGFRPVKIFVSEKYVRAAPGGTGEAKAAGNYAGSLIAGKEAQEAGCSQVLWLDAAERKYVEEIGAMNVMFVIDGTLITSPLDGAILAGITRDSILTLARDRGMRIEERALSIDELIDAIGRKRCSEAFGCGTAAVVTPIRSFRYKGRDFEISDEPGPVAREMLSTITEIQWGRRPDPHGWTRIVRRLSPQLAGVSPTGSQGE